MSNCCHASAVGVTEVAMVWLEVGVGAALIVVDVGAAWLAATAVIDGCTVVSSGLFVVKSNGIVINKQPL